MARLGLCAFTSDIAPGLNLIDIAETYPDLDARPDLDANSHLFPFFFGSLASSMGEVLVLYLSGQEYGVTSTPRG